MKYLPILFLCLLAIAGCQNTPGETSTDTAAVPATTPAPSSPDDQYASQSVDEGLSKNIANFLTQDYLKDDMAIMENSDRKFQMYKVDLNADGKPETFVRFMSPYFCGSGGCTFLLLSNEGDVITRFTVTRAPIYVSKTMANGWNILLVKDAGVFKELKYENGSYPSNPSVVEKAPYDAPSGNAEIMFDENYSNAKSYSF